MPCETTLPSDLNYDPPPVNSVSPSELLHIWATQPTEPGDTLSGGENTAFLQRHGYIEKEDGGYVLTEKGRLTVQIIMTHIDNICGIITNGLIKKPVDGLDKWQLGRQGQ